jgi:undecaprenyl pyrophosphate phosphatase UppP
VFATLAIKFMLAVVARVGFGPFAVYRIVLGATLLIFVL